MEIETNIYDEGFVVDTPTKADWCIQRIAEYEEETARMKEIAEQEIAEIKGRLDDITERNEHQINILKGHLLPFFNSVEHKATKTQESYKLLHGTLQFKKPTIKIKRPDDEELVTYLKNAAPEFIKTTFSAEWGEFKKLLDVVDGEVINTETGEKIGIITTEEVPGEFNVKI